MTDDGAGLYADRDSINPRAFAVRHMIIEAVKTRLRNPSAPKEALQRVARGASVEYDASTRTLVVALEGSEARRIPLDGLELYHRGDTVNAVQARNSDARRWDAALEKNRRVIDGLVDEMLGRIATRE